MRSKLGNGNLRYGAWGVGLSVALGALQGSLVTAGTRLCPSDMVDIGTVCIDRYEASLVDKVTREPLSPYYSPDFRQLKQTYANWELLRRSTGPEAAHQMPLPALSDLQRSGQYTPMAVSEKDRVPQGYLSYYSAKRVCEAADKRLCTEQEWQRACRGERDWLFPYAAEYRAGACNVGSFMHPASILHGLSSSGHLDPRLNLLAVAGKDSVLARTGATASCRAVFGADAVYDMVGNLDEWVEGETPVFRGGFYARGTTRGCDAAVRNHGATYFDYSTGVRCCKAR